MSLAIVVFTFFSKSFIIRNFNIYNHDINVDRWTNIQIKIISNQFKEEKGHLLTSSYASVRALAPFSSIIWVVGRRWKNWIRQSECQFAQSNWFESTILVDLFIFSFLYFITLHIFDRFPIITIPRHFNYFIFQIQCGAINRNTQ